MPLGTQITCWHMSHALMSVSQAVVAHTCATRVFAACSVLGNEASALQMYQWAQIATAALLSKGTSRHVLSSLQGSFLRMLSDCQANGPSCPKSSPFLLLSLGAVLVTTDRKTSQWKLLPDAIEMMLDFSTAILESRIPALSPSIGINQGPGMAQPCASGNWLLSFHGQPLRCCGSERTLMNRHRDGQPAQRKLLLNIIFPSLVKTSLCKWSLGPLLHWQNGFTTQSSEDWRLGCRGKWA